MSSYLFKTPPFLLKGKKNSCKIPIVLLIILWCIVWKSLFRSSKLSLCLMFLLLASIPPLKPSKPSSVWLKCNSMSLCLNFNKIAHTWINCLEESFLYANSLLDPPGKPCEFRKFFNQNLHELSAGSPRLICKLTIQLRLSLQTFTSYSKSWYIYGNYEQIKYINNSIYGQNKHETSELCLVGKIYIIIHSNSTSSHEQLRVIS